MLEQNCFLEKCALLSELGYRPALEPGMRVARGFADLGYEEFVVAAGDRLVSLFTGAVSQLSAIDREHISVVPSCDELITALSNNGYDIQELEYVEQRCWNLTIVSQDKVQIEEQASSIKEVLILAFIGVLRSGVVHDQASNH